VTSGVSKNGTALFPLMPYQHYASQIKKISIALSRI